MPEPLWKIRQHKGMSVNQLAARSGVPAISISEYESGQPIRSADLPKLAKALYVEEWDIEIQGTPLPKRDRPKPSAPPPPDVSPLRPAESSRTKARPAPAPARPSQIEHLLTLITHHFEIEREALEEEIGKPLEALTRREASSLLNRYQKPLTRTSASDVSGGAKTKRKRAYLPESVDEFELQYLTSQQEAGATLYFTLFNGQKMSGTIVGFGPYSITIRDAQTGEDVTLQKLAIAYYRVGEQP